jgi:hypothetical protein
MVDSNRAGSNGAEGGQGHTPTHESTLPDVGRLVTGTLRISAPATSLDGWQVQAERVRLFKVAPKGFQGGTQGSQSLNQGASVGEDPCGPEMQMHWVEPGSIPRTPCRRGLCRWCWGRNVVAAGYYREAPPSLLSERHIVLTSSLLLPVAVALDSALTPPIDPHMLTASDEMSGGARTSLPYPHDGPGYYPPGPHHSLYHAVSSATRRSA